MSYGLKTAFEQGRDVIGFHSAPALKLSTNRMTYTSVNLQLMNS
jgi:hypothetical protein